MAVKTGPQTMEIVESELADKYRKALFEEFGQTALSGDHMGKLKFG